MLALMISPGPSNTLLFLAGADQGLRRAVRLLPVELAAFLATVVPLALAGRRLLQGWPGLTPAISLAAGLWVAWLALRLWRASGPSGRSAVTPGLLAVTTLMNPKALIFGLVLVPAGGATLGVFLTFAAVVSGVGLCWMTLGSTLALAGEARRTRVLSLLRRAAALWLWVVAALLIWRVVNPG